MRRDVYSADDVRALADELAAVVDSTDEHVDRTLASLEALKAFFSDRRALRAEARAAIETDGAVWPFALAEPHRNPPQAPARH